MGYVIIMMFARFMLPVLMIWIVEMICMAIVVATVLLGSIVEMGNVG